MNPVDIPAIAEILARTSPAIPAGATVRTGGLSAAEGVEHLIDAAAQAGAFTDLADRPSVEVSTLTHAGREVWILLEFDRDHRLLRAGPVPIAELTSGGTQDAKAIAELLGRIRRLLAAAVLLGAPPPRSAALAVRPHRTLKAPARLSIGGSALDELLLDTVRRTCLDLHDEPGGDAARLGTALAAVRENALSKAQAYGPDPIPAHLEALRQEADDAEDRAAADHLPAGLTLSLDGAGHLVAALIDALATVGTGQPTTEGPVTIACRKRRAVCAELLASASHAQEFVFEHAKQLPHEDAMEIRRWVEAINADVVRASQTILLLSELAEDAEARGEVMAARAADDQAELFERQVQRVTGNAWFAAAETLHLAAPPADHACLVAEWERSTGWTFVRG